MSDDRFVKLTTNIKLKWAKVVKFSDREGFDNFNKSIDAHNDWIQQHDVQESEITSEKTREELHLLEHAIDEGALFDDEFNRYELCMKYDGYAGDHWRVAAKNGLVNVIPHCSDNSYFHHIKCAFCVFSLKTDSSFNIWNEAGCTCGIAQQVHRDQTTQCSFLATLPSDRRPNIRNLTEKEEVHLY